MAILLKDVQEDLTIRVDIIVDIILMLSNNSLKFIILQFI